MKHQFDPARLAVHLDGKGELPPQEFLEDMRENPEIYFPDHVAACEENNLLPLSETAWRMACLTS